MIAGLLAMTTAGAWVPKTALRVPSVAKWRPISEPLTSTPLVAYFASRPAPIQLGWNVVLAVEDVAHADLIALVSYDTPDHGPAGAVGYRGTRDAFDSLTLELDGQLSRRI
jgi:hypothetical protein